MAARATLQLGPRKGGLADAESLRRELDSLRGYRDVLHDTMKGLVSQASNTLPADAVPDLVSSLQQVAAELAALRAAAPASTNTDDLRVANAKAQQVRLSNTVPGP